MYKYKQTFGPVSPISQLTKQKYVDRNTKRQSLLFSLSKSVEELGMLCNLHETSNREYDQIKYLPNAVPIQITLFRF